MPTYLNPRDVPLSVGVFLATDHYDYEPNVISATKLLKPIRQTILTPRVPAEQAGIELLGLYKSRLGTAIHDGIERAWLHHREDAMAALGIPRSTIDKIKVNPDPEDLEPGDIPVYLEQRYYKNFEGRRISGKVDFIAEGRLEDFKSTSTFTWINATKDDDHKLQGSIYRWLAPDIITQNHMAIQYLFTDWKAGMISDPKYPQQPAMQKLIPLMSLDDTEEYVRGKLTQFDQFRDLPEEALPLCTDADLWRGAPTYKYYKNPAKTTRSTKNFDTPEEAYQRLSKDGNVGIVVEVPGQAVACKFCSAFPVCTQKDALIADGSLRL